MKKYWPEIITVILFLIGVTIPYVFMDTLPKDLFGWLGFIGLSTICGILTTLIMACLFVGFSFLMAVGRIF